MICSLKRSNDERVFNEEGVILHLTDEKLAKRQWKYFPEDFDLTNWEVVAGALEEILAREINQVEDLLEMIKRYSEFQRILRNELAWRYINMTRYADQEQYTQAYNDFYANIASKVIPYDFKLKKKFYDSEQRKYLPADTYGHLNKIISNSIELYREENIPLFVQEQELSSKYGQITSQMTVNYRGEEKTLQQMAVYLREEDRGVREEAWRLISERLEEDAEKLDQLFDQMKEIRIQIAKNAESKNYRDYMHQKKDRFSYTPEDLYQFHEAVEKVVVPFLEELNQERKERLGVGNLRPWDLEVPYDGIDLKPFADVDEFVDKAIAVLHQVKPEFALNLNKMKNSGFLDLDNRKGKAPGGYCTSIHDHGATFIYMNAVGLHEDVTTLVHESGHAMHFFAIADQPIIYYAETPHEIAELASMSMEFLTMDYWDLYYPDKKDLEKAQKEQLINTLKFLPWFMTIDAFQHWIYTNPEHTAKERSAYFAALMDRFNPGVDWQGLDLEKQHRWMRQLHIFEVPFYYIEYGIAQLGALAMYKNYKEDRTLTVERYEEFLQLGYTKSMKEVYEAAGIKFDFSIEYIREIVEFVKEELARLQ